MAHPSSALHLSGLLIIRISDLGSWISTIKTTRLLIFLIYIVWLFSTKLLHSRTVYYSKSIYGHSRNPRTRSTLTRRGESENRTYNGRKESVFRPSLDVDGHRRRRTFFFRAYIPVYKSSKSSSPLCLDTTSSNYVLVSSGNRSR